MIGVLIFFFIGIGINWLLQQKDGVKRKERIIVFVVSIGFLLLAELFFFYQDQWTLPMLLRKASEML